MAASRLDIDNATILDNVDERHVEFAGEVDGDEYQFAVQYDLLEALSGDAPEDDANLAVVGAATASAPAVSFASRRSF